jgi:hypothetical protein
MKIFKIKECLAHQIKEQFELLLFLIIGLALAFKTILIASSKMFLSPH